jgi:hypothetical protein
MNHTLPKPTRKSLPGKGGIMQKIILADVDAGAEAPLSNEN